MSQRSIFGLMPSGNPAFEKTYWPNEDTSGSSSENSPVSTLTVDVGSLTLAEFVERLEASGQRVMLMVVHFDGVGHVMPVTAFALQPNVDHFGGQGDWFVEDVVYALGHRQRDVNHGAFDFQVQYVGRGSLVPVQLMLFTELMFDSPAYVDGQLWSAEDVAKLFRKDLKGNPLRRKENQDDCSKIGFTCTREQTGWN
ncbi:unnamed protein product, partial [Mesorhabditis belari]|uniref:Uncharacterized protein n=1 Tax=Mesorhabditis belari TaxID=2138241 RepID=A0AAF3FFU9_9BILA